MDMDDLLLYQNREKLKSSMTSKKDNDSEEKIEVDDGYRAKLTKGHATSSVHHISEGSDNISSGGGSSSSGNASGGSEHTSSSGGGTLRSFGGRGGSDTGGGGASTSAASASSLSSGSGTVSSGGTSLSSGYSSGLSVPSVTRFAIVKTTGTDFGRSAYTVGKGASARAMKSLDYITRDGAVSNDKTGELKQAEQALYDSKGDSVSLAQTKESMEGITGERRMVFAPNSLINLSDKEFNSIISETLNSFKADYSKNFDYFVAVHRNTNEPHAHILMTTKGIGGADIKFFKDELAELKQRFYDNTQELAEKKLANYEINYTDRSAYSNAREIARFTGDIPAGEFSKGSVTLAKKVAERYDIDFDEKAITDNKNYVKDFFENNKDKYQEYITNSENRISDTFTKYTNQADALSSKYNLGTVPKEFEKFQNFLQKNEKLFLADKIASEKNLIITKEDVKNFSLEFPKDENGKLTKEGISNLKQSMQWFEKNESALKEWYKDNKDGISKELRGRFDQLNERVDKPFDIPTNRNDGIILNNHYKKDQTIFANDTRLVLVATVDSRLAYFKDEYANRNVSKSEFQEHTDRLLNLKENIKSYNNISESSLARYDIKTDSFIKNEKIIKSDGIKLQDGKNSETLQRLFQDKLSNPDLAEQDKNHIQQIALSTTKNGQISLTSLENLGYDRKELRKSFEVSKIETKINAIDFRATQRRFDRVESSDYKISQTLSQWKEENRDNYEFLSKKRIEKLEQGFKKSIKANISFKGKDSFLDKKIDIVNNKLNTISSNISKGYPITKDSLEAAGISTNKLATHTQTKDVAFVPNTKNNQMFLDVVIKDPKLEYLRERLKNDTLKFSSLQSAMKKEGYSDERINNSFTKETRTIQEEVISKPHNIELGKETISQALYNSNGKIFENIKNNIEVEHGVKIANAKDFATHLDKFGVPNQERSFTSQKIQDLVVRNEAYKGKGEYIDTKIDNNNLKLEKLAEDIKNSQPILKDVAINLGFDTKGMDTKIVSKDVAFIKNTSVNSGLVESYFQDNKKIQELYKNNNLRLSTVEKELEKIEIDKDISKDFSTYTKEVKYEFLTQPFKLQVPQETVSSTLVSSLKMFEKISKQLENEHGVKIKDKQELLNNYDKIGKPSELRTMFQSQVDSKINEFKEKNGLEDEAKFKEFQDGIDAKKIEVKEINSILKETKAGELVGDKLVEKYELTGDKKQDIQILNEAKKDFKLTESEKELNNYNAVSQKNAYLKPLFATDLRAIEANQIIWKESTEVPMEVEIVKNDVDNRSKIVGGLEKLKNDVLKEIDKVEINHQDKTALTKILDENKKKNAFVGSAKKYIDEHAVSKVQSQELFSKMTDFKSISGMQYMAENGKLESVPKNFFETRGIDTSNMEVSMEEKKIDTVKFGSEVNLEQYKEHLNQTELKNETTIEKQNTITKLQFIKPELQKQKEEKIETTKSTQIEIQKPTFEKIDQQELNQLKHQTKEMLLNTNPANVLSSLGIDFKSTRGGSQYTFRLRAEDKTASAHMYLNRAGHWMFKDFGSNTNGSIENVVMEATGMNYKDALNYALDKSGLENLVDKALDFENSQKQIQLTEIHQAKLEALKNANLEKTSNSNVNSKVLSAREITEKDTKVLEYLESRGIEGIPKGMFIIEGQVQGVGANGKEYSYTNIGVGVLTGDMSKPIDLEKVGADIHFLNPKTKADGSIMKTQSFGVKDITIIPGENADGKNISVFESKMDYAAAAVKLDLSETNVIIANGVGNANKIAEYLNSNDVEKVTFFNQNDAAGEKFVDNIVEKANLDKFDFIKYEQGEYKQDINDLVKNGVELEDRLVTNANIETFLNNADVISKLEEMKLLIDKGELKEAQELLNNSEFKQEQLEEFQKQINVMKILDAVVEEKAVDYEVQLKDNDELGNIEDKLEESKSLEDKALLEAEITIGDQLEAETKEEEVELKKEESMSF